MGLLTNIDYTTIWDGIKTYTKKVGRVAARPVLLLYYVMKSEETPKKDKLTIFGALAAYRFTQCQAVTYHRMD